MSNVVIIKATISIQDYERWQDETDLIEENIKDELDLIMDANGAILMDTSFDYKDN